MDLGKYTKTIERLIVDNMPTILTGVGVIGTIGTAVLAHKGTVKADKIVADEQFKRKTHGDTSPVTKTDTFKLVWLCYVPTVATGVTTCAAIVLANRINAKRMAALVAGYSLLDGRFEEYKDKMKEKLGVQKEEKARAEISQDHVDKNPPSSQIIVSDGKVMFRDEPSGRYFESTMEDVKRAQNDTNYQILRKEYATLSDFYDRIGLSATSLSEEYGWDLTQELVDINFTSVIHDGRPIVCIDYNVQPVRNGFGGSSEPRKIRAV